MSRRVDDQAVGYAAPLRGMKRWREKIRFARLALVCWWRGGHHVVDVGEDWPYCDRCFSCCCRRCV